MENLTSAYALNKKNKCDGMKLLLNTKSESIATAFFDPQYRSILDKLRYGNEGQGRGNARCSLPQMNESAIISFIKEIDRVLVKSGHLFLWVDKFCLCEGVAKWFTDTDLHIVDLFVWDKKTFGLGWRSRHVCEFLVVCQKSPVRVKGCWSDHTIRDLWDEKVIKTHPHSKPVELQRRLIASTTKDGDIVLDPASGGYSVFEACKLLNRDFLGSDICYGDD